MRTTFPVSTPFFHGLLDRLIEEEGSIFKGPYLSIQLPFRQGREGADFFPDVPLPFPPYLHQERAFKRLGGAQPQSTIVATGTGSGKTESFLVPILDYCYRHRGEQGIKALLIYPMNALANDQAKRLARLIHGNTKLRGHVTAGLFVGQSEKDPRMAMAPDGIITNKDTLRLQPPDILLTNYKMLDYLMIRPRDYPLWQQNTSETLRFLVVDELHTFDGAQGTDLACLIRRLKARLGTPERYLCCVGTSATLGDDQARDDLQAYAEKIFGEPFDEGAVITEARVTAAEFLEDSLIVNLNLVSQQQASLLDPESHESYGAYIRAQYRLWFGETDFAADAWRVELGEKLKGHLIFQNLLKVLKGGIRSHAEILAALEQVTPELREANSVYKQHLLDSLIALTSAARVWTSNGGEDRALAPFLNVREQLWLRELRRMVGSIERPPRLTFADDLTEEQRKTHLPLVHCRECGSMAWAGQRRQNDAVVEPDLQRFYLGYFRNDPNIIFLFPDEEGEPSMDQDGTWEHLCGTCLHTTRQPNPASCLACQSTPLLRVFIPNTRTRSRGHVVGIHDCPYCESKDSLTILGSRAASLTSVLIAQLYSSTFNDDKKLLTFSDSVQDASHRAGFFSARTYQFNFRSALQQFIEEKGDGLTLAQLPDDFIQHWSQELGENAYIATFLGPNMTWFQDYEYLKTHGGLPAGSRLRQDVDRRVNWEIFSEYGFRARIGRTLEKSGSSVVHPDLEMLGRIVPGLLDVLRNEIGELRALDEAALCAFLSGLLSHLKTEGAIHHPVLDAYVENWGNTYLINRHFYMPYFGRQARAPAFLTTHTGTRFDQLFSHRPGTRTWNEAWAIKCFPILTDDSLRRLYVEVLKALVGGDILEQRHVKGDEVWGIRPEALRVSRHVRQFRCDRCGHNTSVASVETEHWKGTPCLRFRCTGRYTEEPVREDYYRKLYATGDIERIFAEEHTGLLERTVREDLEATFTKHERDAWDPNLLSCTPTLEMGIDIGDLSSVILCSVPPAQANYVQRIGRAGRRDGNALTLTVANGRPHDLFFFAEPEEMVAGRVEPPGVFLRAAAVLERQFTAFCFDRWVESGITPEMLPTQLRQVLANLEPFNEGAFPFTLLRFIENNQTELLRQFVALFGDALTENAKAHVRRFAEGEAAEEGSLGYKILTGLHGLLKERTSLQRKVRTLRDKIRKKEKDPVRDKNYEQELGELQRERRALQGIIHTINDKNTFNFLTDEGLLPNYAFPQAGIILRSVIYRKKTEPDEGGAYDTRIYEYERPAVSAIDELAPANRFYAEGRRVEIDQVDLSVSQPETWRFCNNCAHAELLAGTDEHKACPRCGSPMWADGGQKRQMARMRQVFATTSDRLSRTGDDSDNREPAFYNKQMLVDFEDHHITSAFKVASEELPFGFEFLSKATFREINFGEKDAGGDKVIIAGVELPRKGFALCRHCGKVQNTNGEIDHALTCTARDQAAEENVVDCLYLYREFSSEAIRILLPVTTFAGSNEKLHSFIAALQLGLKRSFGGRIDHLQTTVYEEPIPDSYYRKKYLILYDTVPGGTGYLKELMRSTGPLLAVFDEALSALTSCPCHQDPAKDGCYRCLYAYRNSYDMADTSRDVAIELLSEILKRRDQFTKTDTLRNVPVNVLFDSELEARFVEALRRMRHEERSVMLKKQLVRGKPGYFFKIADEPYYIEPQVNLGAEDGVHVPSRADFVFWPASRQREVKPIVVFTDGFFFHKERVGRDLAQRMAIVQSGRFYVWSLTWKDVENQYRSQGNYYRNFLGPGAALPNAKAYNPFIQHYDTRYRIEVLRGAHAEDSFAWLIQFLAHPDEEMWRGYAFVHGLLHADQQLSASPDQQETWVEKLEDCVPGPMAEQLRPDGTSHLYGLYEPVSSSPLRLFMSISQEAVQAGATDAIRLACCLFDAPQHRATEDFEAVWNGFLRLYNLFQFVPRAFFVTSEGQKEDLYSALDVESVSGPLLTSAVSGDQAAWEEVLDLTDPEVHDLLGALAEEGWPVPEAGYELVDQQGAIVATAELGWPEEQIAFLREDEQAYAKHFEAAGWQVVSLAEALANPASYRSLSMAQ